MLTRRVLSLVKNCTRAPLDFWPRLLQEPQQIRFYPLKKNYKYCRNFITLTRVASSEAEPQKNSPKEPQNIEHAAKGHSITRNLPPLSRIRKKRPLTSAAPQERQKSVVALSLAESFDLDVIHNDAVLSSLYNVSYIDRDCDDALYMTKKKEYNVNDELSEMFLFEEGVVVFWNVEANQRVSILRNLERFATGPYDSKIALEEQDRIPFVISDADGQVDKFSGIKSDTFYLDERRHNSEHRTDPQSVIQRFALSQGFAASVKIGVWETLLYELSEPLSESTRQLKEGKIPWNQSQALRKSGEFAALRHAINLDCNLLNRDFYWNREDVEKYCVMSVRHFLVDRRLRALNTRLDYCEEFVKMVDNMLALRHASNLEWMIIVLIVIEVIFDIFHFADSSPKKVIVVTEPVVPPSDS